MKFCKIVLFAMVILHSAQLIKCYTWYRLPYFTKAMCPKGVYETKLSSSKTFEMYGFPDWLVQSCKRLGYTKPTSVQELALPVRIDY